ncbi:MAG: hypothetical protein HY245_15455 [Rhizobiales bacterium]|nr:hypothetical protein [Hyphomicrobiales bacterium]MBI3674783.1 hypothetical protein [Hyphomicrobiales bacterium]
MRSRVNLVLFLLLFALPFMVVTAYELLYATDRYNSDAMIEITQQKPAAIGLDLSVLGLPAPANNQDPLIVIQFINSLDMLQYLEQQLQVREHYSSDSVDWWSRLPASASVEDFHTYMANYIVTSYDSDSQLISIHVEAFNREFAQKVVNAILNHSQDFIDKLNAKVTVEQSKFLEIQLAESEKRLREVTGQLLQFQRDNRLMTTDTEAALVSSNISDIEKQLLTKKADLDAQSKGLSTASPVLQTLKSQIDTLKVQLAHEKDRLAGTTTGAVSELSARYKEISMNLDFVTNIYKSNLTQLETARIDAIQRLKYLVVVTQPSIADESLYPNRPWILGTAAMVLLMIYFIVSLIVAIIREHT